VRLVVQTAWSTPHVRTQRVALRAHPRPVVAGAPPSAGHLLLPRRRRRRRRRRGRGAGRAGLPILVRASPVRPSTYDRGVLLHGPIGRSFRRCGRDFGLGQPGDEVVRHGHADVGRVPAVQADRLILADVARVHLGEETVQAPEVQLDVTPDVLAFDGHLPPRPLDEGLARRYAERLQVPESDQVGGVQGLHQQRDGFVVVEVTGLDADGVFANEAGGHRWQRKPPNDKRDRTHTSTVTVAVMPLVELETLSHVQQRDIEEQFTRGSGAGGQHRNKTSSTVILTHKPSGIVVRVESERSQYQNRRRAMTMLLEVEYRVVDKKRANSDPHLARRVLRVFVPQDGDAHADAVGTTDELTHLKLAVGHGRTSACLRAISALARASPTSPV